MNTMTMNESDFTNLVNGHTVPVDPNQIGNWIKCLNSPSQDILVNGVVMNLEFCHYVINQDSMMKDSDGNVPNPFSYFEVSIKPEDK